MHERGKGVKRDREKAAHWHRNPTGWGYTLLEERAYLHEKFPFLNDVVDEYLSRRPEGGLKFSLASKCGGATRVVCEAQLRPVVRSALADSAESLMTEVSSAPAPPDEQLNNV
jgi:hypothetical protein